MTTKLAVTLLIVGGMFAPLISYSADDADQDRSHPKAFVKDSAITTKIKTKLAAAHLSSLARIHVDTDADGVVWLTGYAHSQDEMDKAVEIARSTEHVVDVRNNLKIKADD